MVLFRIGHLLIIFTHTFLMGLDFKMEWLISNNPASNCMFKVNNRNTRATFETCSKLTIKTSKRRQWRRSGAFIVNFEHTSYLVPVFYC